jgi:predicted nucleotidyltransferase
MNISDTQINEIKSYLSNEISPYLIMIFGSAYKGSMTPDSDIDIAFLSDKKVEPYELFMIAQGLADKLGRDVDLVNLETASTVFKAQVIAKGKVILDKTPNRRRIFQMNSFKEYATLNEQRQCILDKIEQRGSIF